MDMALKNFEKSRCNNQKIKMFPIENFLLHGPPDAVPMDASLIAVHNKMSEGKAPGKILSS